MGLLVSRMGAYANTMMMDTDTMLHFNQELQRQMETARAAGNMQTLQQGQYAAGGIGGGGPSVSSGLAMYNFMQVLRSLSFPAIPIGLISIGAIYALNQSQMAMFGAVFFTVFFAVTLFLMTIEFGKQGINTGTNLISALFIGGVVGGLVAFIMYSPKSDNDDIAYVRRRDSEPDPFFTWEDHDKEHDCN